MTATGHALIGTVIAAKFANPALAIPIALVSHVIADSIPHWDTGTHRREKPFKNFLFQSACDVILGFALSFLLIHFLFPSTSYVYAFIIIIAAQFFDWLTAPYFFLKMHRAPFTWFYKFQKSFDHILDKPWGIVTQTVVVLLVIFLAKTF